MVRAADAGVKLMAVEMKACSGECMISTIFPAPCLTENSRSLFSRSGKRERLPLYLPRQWLSHMRQKLRMGRTIDLEVIPCFCEAQLAVDRPPDHIGIAIILPIILPPAHRAQSV